MKKRKRRKHPPRRHIKLTNSQRRGLAKVYACLLQRFPDCTTDDFDLTCYPKSVDVQSILHDLSHASDPTKIPALVIEKGISESQWRAIDEAIKIFSFGKTPGVVLLKNAPTSICRGIFD